MALADSAKMTALPTADVRDLLLPFLTKAITPPPAVTATDTAR
jgi:hypothetical protein